LSDFFAVDSVDCSIVAFSLINADGSVYTSSQIYIDGSNLKMTTQNLIIKTVYIEAETKGGIKSTAIVSLEVTLP
jgi:hypothetical protein